MSSDGRLTRNWLILFIVLVIGVLAAFRYVFLALIADAGSDREFLLERPLLAAAAFLIVGLFLGFFTAEKPWLLAIILSFPAFLLLALFASSRLDIVLLIHLAASMGSAFLGVYLGRWLRARIKSRPI